MPHLVTQQPALHTSDPFFSTMQEALQSNGAEKLNIILDDRDTDAPNSPWTQLNRELLDCLTDRSHFRAFVSSKGLPTPAWKTATAIEELGLWIMKRNKFPLALKPCKNASNGAGVFKLEGFRELSGFYEKIQTFEPGPVIVEDWIEAQALIEISMSGTGSSLITQVGLDRTLLARWKWRMYPIQIPKRYQAAIDNIMRAFEPFFNKKGTIFRISVALLNSGEALPIAISGSANRLEYFPGWCESAGVPPLVTSMFSPVGTNLRQSAPVRLQFFRGHTKGLRYPSQLPKKAAHLGVIKYAAAGRNAAVLLPATQSTTFTETIKLLAQILEEEASAE